MKLTIPEVPMSLNKVLVLHWRTRSAVNDLWRVLVRSMLDLNGESRKATGKMRCQILLSHSRFYDKDNAYGAVKPLVDALKHWKLIYDDTAEWLELSVEQEKCTHKQRHTIVELESA